MAADVSVAGIDLASRENRSGVRQDNVAGREVHRTRWLRFFFLYFSFNNSEIPQLGRNLKQYL